MQTHLIYGSLLSGGLAFTVFLEHCLPIALDRIGEEEHHLSASVVVGIGGMFVTYHAGIKLQLTGQL